MGEVPPLFPRYCLFPELSGYQCKPVPPPARPRGHRWNHWVQPSLIERLAKIPGSPCVITNAIHKWSGLLLVMRLISSHRKALSTGASSHNQLFPQPAGPSKGGGFLYEEISLSTLWFMKPAYVWYPNWLPRLQDWSHHITIQEVSWWIPWCTKWRFLIVAAYRWRKPGRRFIGLRLRYVGLDAPPASEALVVSKLWQGNRDFGWFILASDPSLAVNRYQAISSITKHHHW